MDASALHSWRCAAPGQASSVRNPTLARDVLATSFVVLAANRCQDGRRQEQKGNKLQHGASLVNLRRSASFAWASCRRPVLKTLRGSNLTGVCKDRQCEG